MLIMMSSLMGTSASITFLPPFTPTPKMLELHKDKGKEPWEIYAWCVRDAISKHSGIPKLDEKLCLSDKKGYI